MFLAVMVVGNPDRTWPKPAINNKPIQVIKSRARYTHSDSPPSPLKWTFVRTRDGERACGYRKICHASEKGNFSCGDFGPFRPTVFSTCLIS